MSPITRSSQHEAGTCLRIASIVAGLALLLVVVIAWPLAKQHPWIFSVRGAIDLNSGDLVRWTYVCGSQISEDIQISLFSQELRRAGVDIPRMRHWKRTYVRVLSGRTVATDGAPLIEACELVLQMLDRLKTLDTTERSALLREALAVLQTGDYAEMRGFTDRLGVRLWASLREERETRETANDGDRE